MNDNSSHYRSRVGNRSGWLRSPVAALILFASIATGCTAPTPAEDLRVVATTTVLGDVARRVVGGGGTVEVLLPAGSDPHAYQASSRQVAGIMEADLVIANGLHLEEGLDDALDAAAADGVAVLRVAEHLSPLPFGADGGPDPHVWLDPLRMARAAELVAEHLERIAPGEDWAQRAEAYAADLAEADAEIVATLAAIPPERRLLVSGHDSLGYFADRYGFEVLGTVVPGGSTLAEPSSADLSALVAAIREADVPAIFVEAYEASPITEAVAAELGPGVQVVALHTGSLGEPGSGADTLIGMLLSNAAAIAGALS